MDRGQTIALMAARGIRPNRRLGQNFLVDEKAAERIAELSGALPADLVLEVGPGLGALTCRLARRAGHVLTVEIDRGLIPALTDVLAGLGNVTLVQGDFLDYDLAGGIEPLLASMPDAAVRVAANVPYYITTPILRRILTWLPGCPAMVFLLQKEAAARLMAPPGNGEYGPAGVCLSAFYDTRLALRIPPHSFYPQPAVDSVVLQAVLRHDAPDPGEVPRAEFLEMVDAAFSHRRKRLVNSMQLSGKYDEGRMEALRDVLAGMGLKESCRAEEIGPEAYLTLFRQWRIYRPTSERR